MSVSNRMVTISIVDTGLCRGVNPAGMIKSKSRAEFQPMEAVMSVHSYACKNYPGNENCPGLFQARTAEELWKHIELHGQLAHNENPATWSNEDKAQVKALVMVKAGGAS